MTTCPHGHEMTPENTHSWARATGKMATACKICRAQRARTAREQRAEREGRTFYAHDGTATHCRHGHAWTEKNTQWVRRRSGVRERFCRECRTRYANHPQSYASSGWWSRKKGKQTS